MDLDAIIGRAKNGEMVKMENIADNMVKVYECKLDYRVRLRKVHEHLIISERYNVFYDENYIAIEFTKTGRYKVNRNSGDTHLRFPKSAITIESKQLKFEIKDNFFILDLNTKRNK